MGRSVRLVSLACLLAVAASAGWSVLVRPITAAPPDSTSSVIRLAGAASLPAAAATQPATASAPTTAPDLTDALVQARGRWLGRLGDGFSGAVGSPFLVVIDADESQASAWLKQTVQPAAERLHKQFTKVQPDRPITVLLFTGQASYRKACKEVLGVESPPYYGFFRPQENLLVMDIHTGGGTLVHELTHALIAFDFPDIPDWLNEGLGSLYEQCRYSPERLIGLVNWRLPALQKAIADDKLGTLAELPGTDFRGQKMGLHYAQARYLCFYMQQQGCLESFYKAFRDGRSEDPTGLKFLRQAFQPRTLEHVEKDWRQWVSGLKWPP